MWNLSLFGKITIFKTLAPSKITHLPLVTVSTASIQLLSKIQKEFLWEKMSLRLNMTPYVMIMKMGLKSVDIFSKDCMMKIFICGKQNNNTFISDWCTLW